MHAAGAYALRQARIPVNRGFPNEGHCYKGRWKVQTERKEVVELLKKILTREPMYTATLKARTSARMRVMLTRPLALRTRSREDGGV